MLCSPFTVSKTRGSASGPLRQTLAECVGPRPLCTGRSSVPASRPQKSNPPPSAWRFWRPRSLTPDYGVCSAECPEGSFWAVVWAAWQGPANSPSILRERRGEKSCQWKNAPGTQAECYWWSRRSLSKGANLYFIFTPTLIFKCLLSLGTQFEGMVVGIFPYEMGQASNTLVPHQ